MKRKRIFAYMRYLAHMTRKLGQVALEFLMTYGWAIMAVIIVMGVLAFYGIFSSTLFSPGIAAVNPPFYVDCWNIQSTTMADGEINLELKNQGGEDLTIQSISVSNCGSASAGSAIASGGGASLTVLCDSANSLNGREGKLFKGDIDIIYRKSGSMLDLSTKGAISDRISKGTLPSVAPPGTGYVTACAVLNTSGIKYIQRANIIPTANAPCINITTSNVIFDGNGYWISNNTLEYPAISAENVVNITVKNVNLSMTKTYNTSGTGYGVWFANVDNSLIANVIVSENAYGIYIWNGMGWSRNNIIRDIVGYNNTGVVRLAFAGPNNTVSNVVSNGDIRAIILAGGLNSSVNNVTANNNRHAIYLQAANDNSISDFRVENSRMFGIYVLGVSSRNFFSRGVINGTNGTALYMASGYDNLLQNITVLNTSRYDGSAYDFRAGFNINGTTLVDMPNLGNYSFISPGTLIAFKNTQYGEIRFTQLVNGSGNNLTADIMISNNYAFINGSAAGGGLNKSANITLYGLPTNFVNPIIKKNDVACPLGECYNFTSLNAGAVIFNVTSGGAYTISSS